MGTGDETTKPGRPGISGDTGAGATSVWNIASYPRSGNHLVRTLVEYAARQPTLGCPGAPRDIPIHQRDANARSGLIQIATDEPKAVKAHWANQIKRNEAGRDADHLLLITRDPADAIASHLARVFARKAFLTERRVRRAIEAELDAYIGVLYAFMAKPRDMRLHVRFEALTDSDNGHYEAQRILDALLPDRLDLSQDAWRKIRQTAGASQGSLDRRSYALKNRIRARVLSYITYAEVDAFIQTGSWSALPQRRAAH
ncbi:hypothetical protein [Roseovarius salis]|uniref:hypothetical protein n=1 Tax=Roseovarius salis TaxID=3376063 RepID=UPI0037CC63EE